MNSAGFGNWSEAAQNGRHNELLVMKPLWGAILAWKEGVFLSFPIKSVIIKNRILLWQLCKAALAQLSSKQPFN